MSIKRLTSITLLSFICILLVTAGQAYAREYILDDLYNLILERSEKVQLSNEDLKSAGIAEKRLISTLYPKVSAFGGYTRFSETKSSEENRTIQPSGSTTYGIRIDQTFSLKGRELIALDISQKNILKGEFDLQKTREDLLLTVASAYYRILISQKGLDIAKANVNRLKKHRDAAQTRLKIGEVTKTAVLRAEAELSKAHSDVIRAQNVLELSKATLSILTGIEPDFTLKEIPPEYVGTPELTLLQQEAIKNRVELKNLELKKSIALEQIKYVKDGYWPSVALEGVYQRRNDDPSSSSLLADSAYVGVKLQMNLYDGGVRKEEINEAILNQRRAELEIKDMEKGIFLDVQNSYLDYLSNQGVLKSLEDQLTYARDNYNAVSRQYEFGLASNLDLIDANNLLVSAEVQLADARYSYELSLIGLKSATGKLSVKVRQ